MMATMDPTQNLQRSYVTDIAAHCLELAGNSDGDASVSPRQLMRLVRSNLVSHLSLTGHQGHQLAKLAPSVTFRSCSRLAFTAAATQQELAGIVRGVHHATMYWTELQCLEISEPAGNIGGPLSGAVFWGAVLLPLRSLPHLKELTAKGLDAASVACLGTLTQLTFLELQLAPQAAAGTRTPSIAGTATSSIGGAAAEAGYRGTRSTGASFEAPRGRAPSFEAPREEEEAAHHHHHQQQQQQEEGEQEEEAPQQQAPPAAAAAEPAGSTSWDLSPLRGLTRLQVLVLSHEQEANPVELPHSGWDASSTWSTTATGSSTCTASSAGSTASNAASVSSRASHASSYIMDSLRQLSFKSSRLSPGGSNSNSNGVAAAGGGCLPPSLQQLVVKGRCSMSSWAQHMAGCPGLRSLHLTDVTGHIAEQHLTAEGYPALLQALAAHAPRLQDLHLEGRRLPASPSLGSLTELTRLWLSPLPCQREQDWEVLAALPRLKSLGCVVPRVSPPAGALLRAVTELQIRVTAGLAPRSLSLALEAFPCVERLVLHDLNQLLLPGAWEADAGVHIAPVPSVTSATFMFPMAPGVTGKRAAAVLSLLPSLTHLHLQGYFAEDCIPILGSGSSSSPSQEEEGDPDGVTSGTWRRSSSDAGASVGSQLTCLVVDMQRAFNPEALMQRLAGGEALEVLQLPAGEGLSLEQKEELVLSLGQQLPALRLLRWPLPPGEADHLQGLIGERVRLQGSGVHQ